MKIEKILTLIFILLVGAKTAVGASAQEELGLVSPALNVVADESYVAFSCLSDDVISFEANDFEKALNLSYLSSVTITQVPDRSAGVMYLGGAEIKSGQSISRSNIGYLTFEFLGENVSESSFCFTTNYSGYEIEGKLYALKYANSAPIVDATAEVAALTYKNVGLYGKLKAYDKDGDTIMFEVVKQPQNGLLKINSSGEYVYTPINGYTGKDSFKYVALDKYGNYSAMYEQQINVKEQKKVLVYSDICDEKYHVAAINLTENGIISAQEVDGKYYFYPKTEFGRLEYLVMAMKHLDIKIDNTVSSTVFFDDAEIPQDLKGYVNTALEMGIINGKLDSKGNLLFSPNDKITRAEAAVLLNNMFELEKPMLTPVFADSNMLPHWAEDAVYCLNYNGIMNSDSGYISADESLKKDEGVYMLYMLK